MKTELVSENDDCNKKLSSWAFAQLQILGYKLINNIPEKVLNTPWSYVLRFKTSQGYIYLKHTPEKIALEAEIIRLLHDQFCASVPEVIAHNPKLNCFLMKDAGQTLRTTLKQQFDITLFCKAIDQFTSLQLATADHVEAFLDIGVPDWRLDKLPDLYKALLSQKDTLIADGLSEKDISELTRLLPIVSHLCNTLSDYSIKHTIVQPDFSDNNTLIDEVSHTITIIDLGEIVISHPFFSLLNCLQQAKKHYAFNEEDDAYQQLFQACFRNYMTANSKNNLLEILSITRVLDLVYGMLAQYRLMMACGEDKIRAFQPGRLCASMKEFISRCRQLRSQ